MQPERGGHERRHHFQAEADVCRFTALADARVGVRTLDRHPN